MVKALQVNAFFHLRRAPMEITNGAREREKKKQEVVQFNMIEKKKYK